MLQPLRIKRQCLAVDYISRIEDEIVGAYSSETAQRLADELPAREGKEVW